MMLVALMLAAILLFMLVAALGVALSGGALVYLFHASIVSASKQAAVDKARHEAVVARLKLTVQPGQPQGHLLAIGVRDGRRITLRRSIVQHGNSRSVHNSLSSSGAPTTLTLDQQYGLSGLWDGRMSQDIRTGDPRLDPILLILEHEVGAATLSMHADARAALLALRATWNVTLKEGVLKVSRTGPHLRPERAERLLVQLNALIDLLQPPATPLEGMKRVLADPEPGVRRHALARAREVLQPADLRELGELAACDVDPVLAALGEALCGDATRLQALPLSDLQGAADYAAPLIVDALVAARAEACLITLLRHPEAPVRARAATALGQVGTGEAVPALRPLTEGMLPNEAVKRAAVDAINQIRGRVQHGSEGGLMVTAQALEAGALSTAPTAGGLGMAARVRHEASG